MIAYAPPELLAGSHGLDHFRCRSLEQTRWLAQAARQAHGSGTTRVFVVTQSGASTVVAYYAWCMASIALAELPKRMRKGAGRYPQPVALLARLGVDERHEGMGLGAALLADVVARVAGLGDEIGCRGLLVHAGNAVARDFYLHLIPEFESSPTDPLHLLLLLKDIRRSLQ